MSHSFIDYPSSGPDQGIVRDLTPSAASGTAADAIQRSLKRVYDRVSHLTKLSDATVYGVYEPLFEGASGLANISGTFGIADGGGLIASVSGTTARGIINLPETIDYTKPWRFAALLKYGGDSHSVNVQLQNPADTDYGQVGFTIASDGFNLSVGGNFAGAQLADIAIGQKFWCVIASDGKSRVIVATIPVGHAGINGSPGYQSTVLQEAMHTYATTYQNGSHTPPFTGISQIAVSTQSTSNVLLGMFVNQGSLCGGSDPRLQPPAIVPVDLTRPDGSVDTTGIVFLPESYTGRTPCDVIHVSHPNASDEQAGFRTIDPDAGAAFATLRSSGYIMSLLRGSSSSYTDNYASGWGSANSLAVRKQMLDWMRENLPGIRYFHWLGQSMGTLDGLNYHLLYPGELRSLIGISGVWNLSASYNGANSGANLGNTVQAAYPTYYVSLQTANTGNAMNNSTWWKQVTGPGGRLVAPYATYTGRGTYSSGTTYDINDVVLVNATALAQVTDHDPTLRAGAFVNLPMAAWHGDSDTTIPIAHLQAFVTAMSGVGVTVPVVTITGGTHLGTAGLWNATALAAFFAAQV